MYAITQQLIVLHTYINSFILILFLVETRMVIHKEQGSAV